MRQWRWVETNNSPRLTKQCRIGTVIDTRQPAAVHVCLNGGKRKHDGAPVHPLDKDAVPRRAGEVSRALHFSVVLPFAGVQLHADPHAGREVRRPHPPVLLVHKSMCPHTRVQKRPFCVYQPICGKQGRTRALTSKPSQVHSRRYEEKGQEENEEEGRRIVSCPPASISKEDTSVVHDFR